MKRSVVTGGAGFIGSHIAGALAARGDEVIVLDDLSTGKEDNLAHLSGVELRRVDLSIPDALDGHLEGADLVFHQAAIPSVPASVADPVRSHRANVDGTLHLLDACRRAGVRRVVYASSCALYGDEPTLPKRETMPACPLSPYGAQKYIGEVYMRSFWQTYGLETVSLRYFNVFGPRQDAGSEYSGVIAKFIPAVLGGQTPTIYGDGDQTRDFVYVENVVDANLCAAEAPGAAGKAFNVAAGERTAIRDLLGEIARLAGKELAPFHSKARTGDILHSGADVSLAARALGWKPRVPLHRGLELTIEWYRESLAPSAGASRH